MGEHPWLTVWLDQGSEAAFCNLKKINKAWPSNQSSHTSILILKMLPGSREDIHGNITFHRTSTSSFSTQNKKQQRTVWITHPLDQWDQYTSLLLLFLETKVKSNSELPDEWKTGSMEEKYMDLFCFPIISVKRDWGVTDAKAKSLSTAYSNSILTIFSNLCPSHPPKMREREKKETLL